MDSHGSPKPLAFRLSSRCADVDWDQAKSDLAIDEFDNGRSADALRLSFENSQFVIFARSDAQLVGMARLLSDGVCNAYLLDLWTYSQWRRRGVATAMVRHLIAEVPGQHIGWQTDDAIDFYLSLGATLQPEFMSVISGEWLHNDANTAP